MKISRKRLKEIVKEEMIAEAYYGSIPGEPETPAEYGGALDAAEIQRHLSDEIDDEVRLGNLDINDLSIEIVRANQKIPWDKFQAIDDEVLRDIIYDYQSKNKVPWGQRIKPLKEGRVITLGVATDLTTQMNNLAGALQKFDPSALQGQPASDLRAAWIALESSMGDVFGDGLENAAVPTRKPLEEGCGMEVPHGLTDEPMPMPGPPPESNRALEPVYDDDEGQMAMGQLSRLVNDANELTNLLGGQTQLPSWVQAKVTKATDYISAVKNYLQYQQQTPQGLHEMKITKARLAEIVKEELQLEGDGASRQESLCKELTGVMRWIQAILDEPEYMGLKDNAIQQLTGIRDDLKNFEGKLECYFGNVGDHTMEEGGPTQTPTEQEYDALTTMIQRLDGMEGFLMSTTRQKSDEGLTQQAAEQLNALRGILSDLRKGSSTKTGESEGAENLEADTGDLQGKWDAVTQKRQNETKMKISKQRLAEIIKEELTEVGSGFRMHRRPAKITRSPAVPVAQVQKQAKQFKDRQSETLFDKGYQDGLKGEEMQYSGIKAYEAGYTEGENEGKVEEAGRPHSMRGGRTMADLDKDAKTRETDFLKKKDDEKDDEKDAKKAGGVSGP